MASLALGILGSGSGSNCRAILEQIRNGHLRAEVRLVVSDVFDAGILEIAREYDVPHTFLPPGIYRTKLEPAIEANLVEMLREADVNLVVLAGFMRVLKQPMLAAFPDRILNIHPSLLPAFPGIEAWSQALASGAKVTGCTVHLVNAAVDAGKILGQTKVPILPGDTPGSLHARIQLEEWKLYPQVIARFANEA